MQTWHAPLELSSNGHEKELCGGEALTTNNRMELTAAIRALEALKKPCRVELHTDSQYVRDGITKWIFGWQKNGWRTADRKPVKNAELWQELLEWLPGLIGLANAALVGVGVSAALGELLLGV